MNRDRWLTAVVVTSDIRTLSALQEKQESQMDDGPHNRKKLAGEIVY